MIAELPDKKKLFIYFSHVNNKAAAQLKIAPGSEFRRSSTSKRI